MWRRLILGFCMVVALLGLYVKGGNYLNTLQLGQWTTVPALLDLAYLLTIVALVIIVGRELLIGLSSKAQRNCEEEFGSAEGTVESWVCRHCGEPSPGDCPACVRCGRSQSAG